MIRNSTSSYLKEGDVNPDLPFGIIYSLYSHEFLGTLISPYVVQLNEQGQFTYQVRKMHVNAIPSYVKGLDDVDVKLIAMLDECDQNNLIKKHLKGKALKPAEFFISATYTDVVAKYMREFIEKRLKKFFELVGSKPLFLMGTDGTPNYKELIYPEESASILFHWKYDGVNLRYYPTVLYDGQLVKITTESSLVFLNNPAILLVNNTLYHFKDQIDGKRLNPFVKKYFIEIQADAIEKWLTTFGLNLLEQYRVQSDGIKIITRNPKGKAMLVLSKQLDLELCLKLEFDYEGAKFAYGNKKESLVDYQKKSNFAFELTKTIRNSKWEESVLASLHRFGINNTTGSLFVLDEKKLSDFFDVIDWAIEHKNQLESHNIFLDPTADYGNYQFEKSELDIKIIESADWLGLQSKVKFGEFEVPFLALKNHILTGKREFRLPNGLIALIPKAWMTSLNSLFLLGEELDGMWQVKKFHKNLLPGYSQRKEERGIYLQLPESESYNTVIETEKPEGLKAELRAYQQEGLNWLWFLRMNGFGGCLADDMGLGKTLQTLAVILKDRAEFPGNQSSLLVVPSTLLFNWSAEIQKFCPGVSVLIYSGFSRLKLLSKFSEYDIIITSYAIARIDIDYFQKIKFRYLVLDEGQQIKNPDALVTKAVRKLDADFKLILSGTPIENSLLDLYSILSFVNPGLLGNESFFKKVFQFPIEKQKNEVLSKKLSAIIRPFMLRRTKEEVAKDLPEKIEQVVYCNMSDDQEELYEKVKSGFRNEILAMIESQGIAKSQMMILRGLTHLRQLANHPKLIDPTYTGASGKMDEISRILESALSEGHKVLIFSQFVKHLAIMREYLNQQKISYCYLDGKTPAKERGNLVNTFNSDRSVRVFLLSLKAGGLGLNLTAADYVAILDPWWNPAVERQAVDRSHRIGQQKTVVSFRFITRNTVEEKIMALQNRKKALQNQILSDDIGLSGALTIEDIKSILS